MSRIIELEGHFFIPENISCIESNGRKFKFDTHDAEFDVKHLNEIVMNQNFHKITWNLADKVTYVRLNRVNCVLNPRKNSYNFFTIMMTRKIITHILSDEVTIKKEHRRLIDALRKFYAKNYSATKK